MNWNRAELIAWLDRTQPEVDRLTLFELLEIPPTASGLAVQRAFHAIARTRHPDVWRNHLDAAELERLTHVYGRVAAAYATLRDDDSRARTLHQIREKRPTPAPTPMAASDREEGPPGPPQRRISRTTVATEPPQTLPSRIARPSTAPPAAGASPPPAGTPITGTNVTLGARALGFYRRAEASLRVGDLAGALLNLRMALAAEPGSVFLRSAIAEAQSRFKK